MILNCMFFILHENLIPRFFCIMSIRNDIKPPKPLFLINRKSHKLSENNCEISKSAQVRLAILQYFILSSRLITNLQQCYSFSSQHSQMHKHFLCTPGVAGVWLSLFSQQKSFSNLHTENCILLYRQYASSNPLSHGVEFSRLMNFRIFLFRRFLTFITKY